jgi:multicomponent Na+:H+ antiporter subunit G
MIAQILDVVSWGLILIGGAFGVIGGLGILRLPNFFTRIHAAGMAETMCAPLILLAMMLQTGWTLTTFKLLAIFLFLIITSPAATHALAKAARHGGIDPNAVEETYEPGDHAA